MRNKYLHDFVKVPDTFDKNIFILIALSYSHFSLDSISLMFAMEAPYRLPD